MSRVADSRDQEMVRAVEDEALSLPQPLYCVCTARVTGAPATTVRELGPSTATCSNPQTNHTDIHARVINSHLDFTGPAHILDTSHLPVAVSPPAFAFLSCSVIPCVFL